MYKLNINLLIIFTNLFNLGNNSNFQTLSNTSNNIGSCQSKMHVNNLKMRSTDKAPPPYDIYYQRQLQNTLNQRSINEFNNRSNNPTQIMSASMTCASSNSRNINGMYQRQLYPLTSSAYSTNTICSNNTPKQQQQYLKHEKFQNVVSGKKNIFKIKKIKAFFRY